ncbi:MAG: hypothetical protein KIT84_19065 [Labilithrix sp.]|nr:hypothetical protein [Labilithrix sp.]MCW5813136.1 hypothetical protein [Labilithrix sp.]
MAQTRYRVEDGKSCIDIQLRSARQLFDLRDPAPFRERDLDPGAVDHLLTSVREIGLRTPVKINLHIAATGGDDIPHAVLAEAIRAHLRHERNVVQRAIRQNFRHGRQLFFIGAVVLGFFLTLAKVGGDLLAHLGLVSAVLREGLVITGWVAMWRPAEVLLYDWWPLYEDRRFIEKLIDSEIEIDEIATSVAPASLSGAGSTRA